MAKVYFVRLTYKRNGKVCYKFGHTRHNDVLKRFDVKLEPRYAEFDIKCIASIALPYWVARLVEIVYLAVYPKNFRLEDYFGTDTEWEGLSGISELVLLDETEYNRACKSFYKLQSTATELLPLWPREKSGEPSPA